MTKSVQNSKSGPDFLCIGCQKAATDWLYDQLRSHREFWMPPIKELHYFDTGGAFSAKLEKMYRSATDDLNRYNQLRMENRLPVLDDTDLRFLRAALSLAGTQINLNRYAALFGFADGKLSGDITPAYSILDDATISEILRRFPAVKIIFLVRDPIARAWSQLNMDCRQKPRMRSFDVNSWDEVLSYMQAPRIADRSYPSKIFRRWSKAMPAGNIRFFFFDEIVEQPDEVRRDITEFLQADPTPSAFRLLPGFNRKPNEPKVEMSPGIRERMTALFADELRECASLFGGPAKKWLLRYGLCSDEAGRK